MTDSAELLHDSTESVMTRSTRPFPHLLGRVIKSGQSPKKTTIFLIFFNFSTFSWLLGTPRCFLNWLSAIWGPFPSPSIDMLFKFHGNVKFLK